MENNEKKRVKIYIWILIQDGTPYEKCSGYTKKEANRELIKQYKKEYKEVNETTKGRRQYIEKLNLELSKKHNNIFFWEIGTLYLLKSSLSVK
jgi:hypothetical protein